VGGEGAEREDEGRGSDPAGGTVAGAAEDPKGARRDEPGQAGEEEEFLGGEGEEVVGSAEEVGVGAGQPQVMACIAVPWREAECLEPGQGRGAGRSARNSALPRLYQPCGSRGFVCRYSANPWAAAA
jgi:hypothetical protein